MVVHTVAAAFIDTATPIGAGALLALLFGYLFKELRRKDDGVWQIIADRDKQHAAAMEEKEKEIQRLVKDRDFWRDRELRDEDDAHRAASRAASDRSADASSEDDRVAGAAAEDANEKRRRKDGPSGR